MPQIRCKNLLDGPLVLGISCTLSLSAQFDVDRLFGGATIGYANPTGDFEDFAKGGLTYTIVAGYKLTDHLGVGIEYGSAITGAIDTTLDSGIFGIETYGLNNYFLRGWYTFTEGSFAPYVSLGAGLSSVSEPDITSGTTTIEGASRTSFGADLELGVAIKNFNLSYSYVVGGRTPEETVFTSRDGDVGVSYHRFQIGYIYNFGGGLMGN